MGTSHENAIKYAQQFTYQFMAFGNKKSAFITELLLFQTFYVLYVIFAEHAFDFDWCKDSYFSNLLFESKRTFCNFAQL